MARQPGLSLRRGDATANVRMDCLNPEAMKKYFELLKYVLVENDLFELTISKYTMLMRLESPLTIDLQR